MMKLNEIGLKYTTDKATSGHAYLPLYDLLFSRWRNKHAHLLEIGCQFANSAKTWVEYFGNADITMIDAVSNDVKEEGFKLVLGDAYSPEIFEQLNPPYDIIIDDGSHAFPHQLFVIRHYLPLLRDDGVGIIEDVLGRGCMLEFEKVLPQGFQSTCVEMAKGATLVDSRLFIAFRS